MYLSKSQKEPLLPSSTHALNLCQVEPVVLSLPNVATVSYSSLCAGLCTEAIYRDLWPSLVQESSSKEKLVQEGSGSPLPLLLLLQLAPPLSLLCLPGYRVTMRHPALSPVGLG